MTKQAVNQSYQLNIVTVIEHIETENLYALFFTVKFGHIPT
jgi:hypothetical protein